MSYPKNLDDFFEKHVQYKEPLAILRALLLSTELTETFKWGFPTYTINNKNVIGIGAFKNYFGLWFFQGVFLTDTQHKLVNAQEGKTKAMRQLRFTELKQTDLHWIAEYVHEAIQNQKEGKEIKPQKKKTNLANIPPIFQKHLNNNMELQKQFNLLSLSAKNEYIEHIASAKKETTKLRRLDKITPMILNLKGLNDKYKE